MTNSTRIFARILGPFLLILGAAFAAGRVSTLQLLAAFVESPALMFLSALFMLTAGLIILAFHNKWSSLCGAIISLIGWALVLRGASMLFLPGLVAYLLQPLLDNDLVPPIGGGVAALLGAWMTALSYAKPISAKSPS